MYNCVTIKLFSVIIIGMLTATPLVNNNIFPNIKAQEYGTYDDDYDNDMYSRYPTEINKYECQNRSL